MKATKLTLCLLQDPWIRLVDGKSLLTVEAFVIYNEIFRESKPVLLTAVGAAADVVANYACVGKLIEVECLVESSGIASLSQLEAAYRQAYQMTAANKTLLAISIIKVWQEQKAA